MSNCIYVFVHLHKTGGTTLNKHIEKNFKKEEVLTLDYKSLGVNPFINKIPNFDLLLEKFFSKISSKKIKKIKVVIGHFIPFGIHKYFNVPAKYITIVRDPYSQAKSFYNYYRTLYEKEDKSGKNKILYNSFLKTGKKIPPFNRWIINKYASKNSGLVIQPIEKYYKNLNYKLSDFYFVGITENLNNDLSYIFSLLDIKKYFVDQNKSENYIKDDEKSKKYFTKKFRKSYVLYKNAKKINEKLRNKKYFLIVNKINKKRKYLTVFTQTFFDFRQTMGIVSSIFRKKSKLYGQIWDIIKRHL